MRLAATASCLPRSADVRCSSESPRRTTAARSRCLRRGRRPSSSPRPSTWAPRPALAHGSSVGPGCPVLLPHTPAMKQNKCLKGRIAWERFFTGENVTWHRPVGEHWGRLQQSCCRAVIKDWIIPFAAYTAAETPNAFQSAGQPPKLPLPVGVRDLHLIHGF